MRSSMSSRKCPKTFVGEVTGWVEEERTEGVGNRRRLGEGRDF